MKDAYVKLKATVKKTGSLRLAFLAAEVRTGGHFDKVIVMIDKMIADLRKEEQDDIVARDKCQEDKNKLDNEAEDLEYNIKKTEELIGRLEDKKDVLEKDIAVKEEEIAATNETMAELLAARNKENEEFKQALKDDTDAVALIQQAIEALTAFYTNNKLPLAFSQEDPKYTVDEDKAPDTFEGDYGGRKSESTGIIAILSMLKEDLEKEIKTGREEEAEAQAEYEKQRAALQETMNKLLETRTALEDEKADIDSKIADAKGEVENKESLKDDKEGELDAMKPNCDWVLSTFDSRREKRKAEIQGLIEAKGMLAGATPGEGDSMEFVQTSDSFLQRKH